MNFEICIGTNFCSNMCIWKIYTYIYIYCSLIFALSTNRTNLFVSMFQIRYRNKTEHNLAFLSRSAQSGSWLTLCWLRATVHRPLLRKIHLINSVFNACHIRFYIAKGKHRIFIRACIKYMYMYRDKKMLCSNKVSKEFKL